MYGKLQYSYDNSNDKSERLIDHLNPTHSKWRFVDGIDLVEARKLNFESTQPTSYENNEQLVFSNHR